MSSSVLLNMPARVDNFHEQELLSQSRMSDMNNLSVQTSSNEETSISEVMSADIGETDSGSLRASEFRKSSSTPPTPETSHSITSQVEPAPRLQTALEKEYPTIIQPKPQKRVRRFSNALKCPQDAFLRFLEPTPVQPPPYNTLPPGGCPRFPVVDQHYGSEELPAYSPAAYKLGVVCRKLEWLSPYEPSPVRSWKSFVVELNSTQLNFYHIPNSLENCLLNFATGFSHAEDSVNLDLIHQNHRSLVTKNQDVQFQQLCEALDFFKNDERHIEDDDEGYNSSASVASGKSARINKNKRLIRSYSLQHARIGLASDYTKKSNCLRLRLESEQFLLNFASTQDLIDWNLGLSMGRDVAMDLAERDIPRYRTVPRRRRTYITGSTSFYHEAVARRSRTSSDSQFEISNGLRGKLSKFKRKLSSPSLNHLKVTSQGQKSVQQQQLQQVKQFRQAVRSSMADTYAPVGGLSSLSVQRESNRSSIQSTPHASFSFADAEDDDDADLQMSPVISHLSQSNNNCDDDGEEDIQNLSDLHGSDDEDDEQVDIDDFSDPGYAGRSRKNTNPRGSSFACGDYKWNPMKKPESGRRFARNCLKCIKPLTFDELWVNKLLMKPAAVAPLSQAYLRNQFFADDHVSKDSSFTSLAGLSIGSGTEISSLTSFSTRRKSSIHRESIFNFSDTSLARTTNHHLKEYFVGSHSLIPKDI